MLLRFEVEAKEGGPNNEGPLGRAPEDEYVVVEGHDIAFAVAS